MAYWYEPYTKSVMRAEQLSSGDASPLGAVLADGVEAWETTLIFQGGFEHDYYDGADSDSTNDGNRIMAVKVRARVQADRTDPAVNGGNRVYRWYEWRVAPRNLMYEKNRL